MQKKYHACALGEMLIDFTYQCNNAQGQKMFAQNPGGAPANVMAAMSKLGADTAFMGKAGNDIHGRFLKDTLNNCGINSDDFILTDDYFTTLAFVDIKPNGEREFSFARKYGADKMFTIEDINLQRIEDSNIFHIGSVSMTEEPFRNATMYAIKKAKMFGCIVSYDPNYRSSLWSDIKTASEQMRRILQYADIVKISEEETELLTGYREAEAAANVLIKQGIKIAVVTLGERGAYVATKDGGKFVGGYEAKVKDTTGAGDSFWGGFLYKLCQLSKPINQISHIEAIECAEFGNAAASICVEDYGAITALPDLEKVIKKMKKH